VLKIKCRDEKLWCYKNFQGSDRL